MSDSYFMSEALKCAEYARQQGEVPVGAVLVENGNIISSGYNQTICCHDPTAHAEMIALRKAGQWKGNYRLPQTILYVTLEPCCMCSGALFHARVGEVVYGTKDKKTGCGGSCLDLFSCSLINHHTKIRGGVCQEQCAHILHNFFEEKRAQKRTLSPSL